MAIQYTLADIYGQFDHNYLTQYIQFLTLSLLSAKPIAYIIVKYYM